MLVWCHSKAVGGKPFKNLFLHIPVSRNSSHFDTLWMSAMPLASYIILQQFLAKFLFVFAT
jgi:hypothetical protein